MNLLHDTTTRKVEIEELIERDGWFLYGTVEVETTMVGDLIMGRFGEREVFEREVVGSKVLRCVWMDADGNEKPAPEMHPELIEAAESQALDR